MPLPTPHIEARPGDFAPTVLMPGDPLRAKHIAEAELADTSATKVTMPFVEDHLDRIKDLMGSDFWSYGLDDANRHNLQTILDQHHRQGLSSRSLQADERFPVNSLEAFSL